MSRIIFQLNEGNAKSLKRPGKRGVMSRPLTVRLAQKIRIWDIFRYNFRACVVLKSGQFRTKIENYGHFRSLLRPSNFELRDFSYKANSFPYANI